MYESCEILPGSIKLRTQINGLLPLIKQYTLELSQGKEIIATLVYEKLENHCGKCLMLSHEEEDFPESLQEREEKAKKDIEAKQKLALSTRRHENERTERGHQEQRRGFQRSKTYNASEPPNPKSSRQNYRPPMERNYDRDNRSWRTMEEGRYGVKSNSRREDSASHLRYNQGDSRGEERWVATGWRFQHSSRSSERELLREGARSASQFRNNREDENLLWTHLL